MNYKQRMIFELLELENRITKLEEYQKKEVINPEKPSRDRDLRNKQSAVMLELKDILIERMMIILQDETNMEGK